MKPRHVIATSVLGALVIALIAVIGLGALPLGPDASPERRAVERPTAASAPEPAPLAVVPVAAAAVPGPDDQRSRCHDRDGRQQAARDDRRGTGPRGGAPRGGGGSA